VNLAKYTDSLCQSSTYTIVVQGTVGVCAKNSAGVQTTFISADTASSPTPAPTVFLDGYMAFSYYRSDRGVVFCGGAFVYADTYKLNTCNAVAFSYGGYGFKSVMIVATSTTQFTRYYADTKCQNLVDIDAATYTAGVCVTGGTDLSLITSISTKMSTDLTVPRVTRT
jgi:hypothetical protein